MSSQVFPTLAGYGINIKRTPVFSTLIQTAASGKELRASFQSTPRWRYEIPLNFARKAGFSINTLADEMATILAFYSQHAGTWDSFLLQDPYDSSDTTMGFGVGNGSATVFQLQRREPGNYTNFLGTFAVSTTPRTNLLPYSQAFDNAAWTKTTGVTVTPDTTVAPDGTVTADKVVYAGGGTAGNDRFYPSGFTSVNGQAYTCSIWVRADAPVSLRLGSNLTGGLAVINITTAWQRFSVTGVGNGVSSVQASIKALNADNSTFTIYVWGGQTETGTVATDYIPTTSAAVTVTPSYYPGNDGFEPITEPAPGIVISKNGTALVQGTDWTLGSSGLVTFTVAPASGAVLTWTGSYYRRVRFDMDAYEQEQMFNLCWNGGTLKLISVK